MPRTARIVIPGVAHHITQRGNNRQTVFLDDEDRLKYLLLLTHYHELHGLRLLAYCLMDNHIHIVGVPQEKTSLAKTLGRVHFQYTTYFQQKYHASGHLWQNRFYSCPMDEDYTINAIAYVELNPVRAGMTTFAWDYPWSSAPAHCTVDASSPLLHLERWRSRFTVDVWRDNLLDTLGRTEVFGAIREHCKRGKPLGNATFQKEVLARLKEG